MWVAGIMQGLMWRAYNQFGFLEYAFSEVVQAMHPYLIIRAVGGILFLIGTLIMAFNLWKTVRSGEPVPASVQAPAAALAAEAA
jgi:cytochrome c oxidase cbb3-type subunit 1